MVISECCLSVANCFPAEQIRPEFDFAFALALVLDFAFCGFSVTIFYFT
jgi:hypothetical protein